MDTLINNNQTWLNETWEKINNKLLIVSQESKEKIPYTTINGIHDDWNKIRIGRWTNGFWPGMMWLMYVGTKDEKYKEVAEISEKHLDKALWDYDNLIHDVGFMWHISSGVNYRLFQEPESKKRMMFAASILASRYNMNGKFIRAWNKPGSEGYAIIDCMMNIPLLYLASELTEDPRFKYIAMSHADTTMQSHIRPDGSVAHVVEFDPVTGDIVGYPSSQGYDPQKSSWSRGQSWALYGFVLSYIHTKKQEYLDTAKKVAHYFIANICDTYVPKCDFRSPDEPVILDTTAGAIAACGLIEIANCVDEFEKKIYLSAAINILKALEKDHCDWTLKEQSILQNGAEAYHNAGHNMPIIYGDYYFIEAIYKLLNKGFLFW